MTNRLGFVSAFVLENYSELYNENSANISQTSSILQLNEAPDQTIKDLDSLRKKIRNIEKQIEIEIKSTEKNSIALRELSELSNKLKENDSKFEKKIWELKITLPSQVKEKKDIDNSRKSTFLIRSESVFNIALLTNERNLLKAKTRIFEPTINTCIFQEKVNKLLKTLNKNKQKLQELAASKHCSSYLDDYEEDFKKNYSDSEIFFGESLSTLHELSKDNSPNALTATIRHRKRSFRVIISKEKPQIEPYENNPPDDLC